VKDLQIDKKETSETCRKGVRSLLAVLEYCVIKSLLVSEVQLKVFEMC